MRRTPLLAGSLVAIVAGLLVEYGGHLGLELTHVALMGSALGAVLGLVPQATPGGRALGFLGGFGAAWIGFALRAGLLPDIPLGRAIAAVIVVSIVTAIATASGGRAPLWAGLLGVGALAGAYETTFSIEPTAFTSDSVTAVVTTLLAAGLGFVATIVIAELTGVDEDDELPAQRRAIHEPTRDELPPQRARIDIATDHPTEV